MAAFFCGPVEGAVPGETPPGLLPKGLPPAQKTEQDAVFGRARTG